MCGIPKNFVTAVRALAIVSLSLRLCVAKVVYAEKGSSVDLPCPCLHCPEQNREMNWYFDQKGAATLLFRKAQHSRVERHPAAWDRLEMLPNYSLRFSNVSDNDTCRYWCEQNNYYDLVVVTGMKQRVESWRTGSVCYILSCSVSAKNIQHSVVSWWEGKKELRDEEERGTGIFKGAKTSQLYICLKKGTAGDREETGIKERRVKCSFDDQLEVTFSLTGAAKDCLSVCPNSTRYLESGRHGSTWIPLAVCVTLQLVVIVALGVMLWRRNHCEKHGDYFNPGRTDVSKPKHRPQLYENVRTRSETA
ncbi:lymphocyte antigen 6 complex locus protein G6f isoform X2 [Sphaerodactylus townsendi]|uniref:lymphocyte antigen 6 complex locus protein G6f isoform X2 n=1 Tax=Sphaerodactylus townsendi TaxID=933632 RepID=UPI00202692B5|nr:lymphocyte antigen 6 complex locus protein G6f isoform X2 [Sphaerodactylus townsendi]